MRYHLLVGLTIGVWLAGPCHLWAAEADQRTVALDLSIPPDLTTAERKLAADLLGLLGAVINAEMRFTIVAWPSVEARAEPLAAALVRRALPSRR